MTVQVSTFCMHRTWLPLEKSNFRRFIIIVLCALFLALRNLTNERLPKQDSTRQKKRLDNADISSKRQTVKPRSVNAGSNRSKPHRTASLVWYMSKRVHEHIRITTVGWVGHTLQGSSLTCITHYCCRIWLSLSLHNLLWLNCSSDRSWSLFFHYLVRRYTYITIEV